MWISNKLFRKKLKKGLIPKIEKIIARGFRGRHFPYKGSSEGTSGKGKALPLPIIKCCLYIYIVKWHYNQPV
jgi:hypothetical protein